MSDAHGWRRDPVLRDFLVPPSLDTDLLRAFVTVAELGSMSRATRFLSLTQSAVSLQIRKLEDLLGTQLFHRRSRGVQLTAAGEAFAVQARQILDLHARAVESVRRARGELELRVGMNDVYAARHLAPVLDAFRRAHPDVRPVVLSAVSPDLVDAFDHGALDLCVSLRHDPSSEAEVIGYEELLWVCSADVTPARDEPVSLAVYPEYCVFRARALRALASVGRDWRIAYTSQGVAAIDVAIDRGWGLAVKAASTVEPRWRVLGEAEGFPPLGTIEVELRASPTNASEALGFLRGLVRDQLREVLGASPPAAPLQI